MKYLDFFDDVYYINLDYRQDRKEKFIKRAEEVGIINPNRLSAFQPDIEDCTFVPFWPKNGTYEEKRLKANEFGTSLSHTEIIKIAKKRNLNNVLIFEDDCVFLDGFKDEVQKCINDLKNIEWDIIFFGGAPNNYSEKITDNISSLKNGGVFGIQSYAVNNTFFDAIIDLSTTFHEGSIMDYNLIHYKIPTGINPITNKPRVYILSKKLLTIQETNFSDLRNHVVETSHFEREWNKYVTNPDPGILQQTISTNHTISINEIINLFITKCNFKSYLEINSNSITARTNIIPKKYISQDESDNFFKENNNKFDVILIDGWHDIEQDFRNIVDSLKHLNENGIIVLHDCNPYIESHTIEKGNVYLGQTYKAYIDAVYTYDLEHFTIDTDWGCAIISSKPDNFDVERKKIINNWNFFDENRKSLLNLVTAEFFTENFENDFREKLSIKPQIFNIAEKKKVDKKISIISAYYNRKELFYRTLKSIVKSEITNFEYIVVDDCSSQEQRLEDLVDEFPFLKIIRLEKENKWYINPCIPFNIGIMHASGDIIVLQNPECLHVHDILRYFSENVNDGNYITMSAFSLNNELTKELPLHIENKTVETFIKNLPQDIDIKIIDVGWFNHSKHRAVQYHFCSAMTKKNMSKLGGFDERFAYGIGFDDDEFVLRVRRLGLKIIIEDDLSVIHQYHNKDFSDTIENYQIRFKLSKVQNNRDLFNNIVLGETGYCANIKVFDCFTFFNELELLELRLMTLYDHVHQFIIVEANTTHSGTYKGYIFEEHLREFDKYIDKIKYIKVELPHKKINSELQSYEVWENENYQRNCIKYGLTDANEEDFVMISDLDEIPNPKVINYITQKNLNTFTLNQKLFYYYVNGFQNQIWHGTMITKRKIMLEPQKFREMRHDNINVITDGGWHYSFIGGINKIKKKLQAYAETQTNTEIINNDNHILHCLETGDDIFFRTEYKKEFISLEEINHQELYEWLKKYPNMIKLKK